MYKLLVGLRFFDRLNRSFFDDRLSFLNFDHRSVVLFRRVGRTTARFDDGIDFALVCSCRSLRQIECRFRLAGNIRQTKACAHKCCCDHDRGFTKEVCSATSTENLLTSSGSATKTSTHTAALTGLQQNCADEYYTCNYMNDDKK